MSACWSVHAREALSEVLVEDRPCVFAIGAFDGVHLGHAELIARVEEHAAAHGMPAVAVLFDPDPSAVLRPEGREPALMAIGERVDALLELDVDAVVRVRFDEELAAMSHQDFIDTVLTEISPIGALFVGEGFRLGAGGAGDVAALAELGRERGFEVFGIPLLEIDGMPVSSSRIRSLVESGEVDAAARLLGRLFAVRGTVVHGRGEGTGLGFPTANISLPEGLCMPAEGVYACWAQVGGKRYPSAVNVGSPRSFAAEAASGPRLVEAHLIGFSGELYGQTLELAFVERIRPQESFATIAELQSAVSDNIEWVKTRLGGAKEVDDDRR